MVNLGLPEDAETLVLKSKNMTVQVQQASDKLS